MRRRIIKKNIRKKRYSSSGGGIASDMTTLWRYGGHQLKNMFAGLKGENIINPSPYPSVQKLH